MDARTNWASPKDKSAEQKIAARWCSFGPYYAMFPVDFARKTIERYTQPGDYVLDPFCGRGTSVFCAGEAAREGFGIEINPVGWLYAKVKIQPSPQEMVEARIKEISRYAKLNSKEAERLPPFFRKCFCPRVLAFLLSARRNLHWRTNHLDSTVMAFLILHLHGRIDSNGRPQALSNQMRQTKAMSQEYSIRWWNKNGFRKPPEVDPVSFLTDRVSWRYKYGRPTFTDSVVKLGDAQKVLARVTDELDRKFSLLLTSPPYSAVTSYYFDQWLRLWMLGDPAVPSRAGVSWKSRFENKMRYRELIETTFERAERLMARDATIYVRTDAREFTKQVTLEALQNAFPRKSVRVLARPFKGATQTALFGDAREKPGEVDIILK